LPEGWSNYVSALAPAQPASYFGGGPGYGAQFWESTRPVIGRTLGFGAIDETASTEYELAEQRADASMPPQARHLYQSWR
jgi:hypothetical protein